MIPSNQKHSTYNDYDAHGEIIQEMRVASRNYAIPVISITQNTRESENMNQNMGNNLIADSFKKVRYSDYIYMIRLRSDADLLHPQVKQDINKDDEQQLSMMEITGQYFQSLVPMEIKITKAKEGKKNMVKFHLFSGLNLRIYSSLSNFISDIPPLKTYSNDLQNQIEMLELNCIQGPQANLDPSNLNMLI
jgi:hypothetical protein